MALPEPGPRVVYRGIWVLLAASSACSILCPGTKLSTTIILLICWELYSVYPTIYPAFATSVPSTTPTRHIQTGPIGLPSHFSPLMPQTLTPFPFQWMPSSPGQSHKLSFSLPCSSFQSIPISINNSLPDDFISKPFWIQPWLPLSIFKSWVWGTPISSLYYCSNILTSLFPTFLHFFFNLFLIPKSWQSFYNFNWSSHSLA